MNKCDEEITKQSSVFHLINNIILILTILGAAVIATQLAGIGIPNDFRIQTSTLIAFASFVGIALTYTLPYIFIRVTIKNYEEILRQN